MNATRGGRIGFTITTLPQRAQDDFCDVSTINFIHEAIRASTGALPCDFFSPAVLISFSIANFRSFREEQTLSMVASQRFTDHPEHLLPIPDSDERGLPVAAMYGANAAGKSNAIQTLERFLQWVRWGTPDGAKIHREPFKLDPAWAGKPTEFAVQFAHRGRAMVYGCRLLDDRVEAEWLSVLSGDRESNVFERSTDAEGRVTVQLGPAVTPTMAKAHPKLEGMAAIGGPPRQLFLHTVGRNLSEPEMGELLATARDWFHRGIAILGPTSPYLPLVEHVAQYPDLRAFIGEFLRKAGTGLANLRVQSMELNEEALARIPDFASDLGQARAKGQRSVSLGEGRVALLPEVGTGGNVTIHAIEAEHVGADGTSVAMPFSEQSDGTRRLAHLLPILFFGGAEPWTIVIDEIDRSLHPLLAKGFVRAFLEKAPPSGAQLLFTTHDTTFLDTALLRRDEIWFAKKNVPPGATELYSLAEFHARKDLRLDKAYLEGRFEATPPIEVELPGWVADIVQELKHGAARPGVAPTS